jgi:hypothetical protein
MPPRSACSPPAARKACSADGSFASATCHRKRAACGSNAPPPRPLRPGESREREAEHELREVLADQGVELREVVVVHRPIGENPALIRREARIAARLGERAPARAREQMIAAIHTSEKGWITVAMPMRNGDAGLLVSLLGQTLLYGVMVGAIALIVGRITRPLAALTGRLEQLCQHPRCRRRPDGAAGPGRRAPPDRGAERDGRPHRRPAR